MLFLFCFIQHFSLFFSSFDFLLIWILLFFSIRSFREGLWQEKLCTFQHFFNNSQNSTQMTPREISMNPLLYKQITPNNNIIIHQLLLITNEAL